MSRVVPAQALVTGVPTSTGPPGDVKTLVEFIPSGIPPVEAGLKYGELSAFSISTLNSADHDPCTFTRFTALRSKRINRGPLTTTLRKPQSPKLGDVSMQSGPLAGAI